MCSLSSRVNADTSVNVDSAKQIGSQILASMCDKSVSEFKFSKKNQVNTLASVLHVLIDGEKVEIDPKKLYQRLLVVGVGTDVEQLLKYELCSYPTSLFDNNLLMRPPDKASLQTGLTGKVPSSVVENLPNTVSYVLDGGALLQKISLPKFLTYEALCCIYLEYIQSQFGNCTIVFDDYLEGSSAKDDTHSRRISTEVGVDIDFTPDMILTMNKKPFLVNSHNKQKFIDLLRSVLE